MSTITDEQLSQLRTLVSHPKLPLTDKFRRVIQDNFQTYSIWQCSKTMHDGMSCPQYWVWKGNRQLKHAAKICIFFSLIPNLVANARKLNQLDTWKTIAKKFIKAVTFYCFAAYLPAIFWCNITRISGFS